MNYATLAGPGGQADNMGGTKQFIYIAPIDDFLTIETFDPAGTTLASAAEIPGDHIFKTGKCFKKIYCTLDKGSLKSDKQGERDGRSFKDMCKIFYPGSDLDVTGFANIVKNDRMMALIPMPDGKVRQIGSEDFYAEISAAFDTGTNSGGIRGTEFEISSMDSRMKIYTGVISLTPAA